MHHCLRLFLLAFALACSAPSFAQQITIKAAKPGGVYAVGEKIAWQLQVEGEGVSGIEKIGYVLKKGGLTEMGRGELTLKDNTAELETRLDAPGTLLAEFTAVSAGKPTIKSLAGAVVAPEKIPASAAPPADFDAFWKAKIQELAAVPMHPVLETADSGSPSVEYSKITLDNVRDSKVRGQLARPKTGSKFPALLVVQWAGVYPLAKGWATDRAREGWLTLNINAHDLPIDSPSEFYKQQGSTALRNYPSIGNEDRETSYFLRMYLSCYRAADYLASRSDWDGKTLVVIGGSQGGLQSMMIGGLHPKVSAVLANIPAGCDQTGPMVGRQPGWPMWYYQVKDKDAAKVRETAKYYDVVNFARRIRCPALVAFGLIDTTCPAAGVLAAFNQIPGPKESVVMEWSGHLEKNKSQAAYYARSSAWLKQLVAGNPPPVPAAQTVQK
ncbi:MAG: acetylxylan esterase [Cytophagales bacterium]|nr:acetylxylan esterase [Armatimonadota bacterium]